MEDEDLQALKVKLEPFFCGFLLSSTASIKLATLSVVYLGHNNVPHGCSNTRNIFLNMKNVKYKKRKRACSFTI